MDVTPDLGQILCCLVLETEATALYQQLSVPYVLE